MARLRLVLRFDSVSDEWYYDGYDADKCDNFGLLDLAFRSQRFRSRGAAKLSRQNCTLYDVLNLKGASSWPKK